MNDYPKISLQSGRYLVLGMGQTGQAVARWLAKQGAALTLVDTREELSLPQLQSELNGLDVSWHFGAVLAPELLTVVDTVVISPGLSALESPIAEFLGQAKEQNKAVINEIELFAQALRSLEQTHDYRPAVVAITGTNGKTTVTALTRQMLQSAGINAVAAGNISPAALDALHTVLQSDREQWPQAWVLELSSFQLHYTNSLSLSAATVLNVTQDHLDWHGSFDAYRQDKARIFENAQICIVNRDDEIVRQMVPALDATGVRSFGSDQPIFVHDVGIQGSHGVGWLVCVQPEDFEDQPKVGRKRKNEPVAPRQTGRVVRLMPVEALPLAGMHNAMNVLASSLLAQAAGASWAAILKAASSYCGEPHRMQFVRTIREVDFFNDSKGTNVGATVAGLLGLNRPVVLIAGGQSKGQDFTPLANALAKCARAVVLIGEDANLLKASFESAGVACHLQTDMASAVQCAFDLAQSGDAVVLSPACASFDMFTGYGQRGEVFVSEVTELSLSLGEVA